MASQPCLRFGPYRLDGASGQLWRHSEVVPLPPKAAAVLWCLARQPGQLVTREQLFATVWAGTVVTDAVLTVCIRELRRALGDGAQRPRYIETVHRRGYRFIAPVTTAPDVVRPPEMGRRQPAPPGASPPSPQPSARSPLSFVGREAEVAALQACLERARGGRRQVLFVTGEAGIGKTTLVEAGLTTLTAEERAWVGWGQCVDTYGPGTGYLPVLEALGRLCRGPAGSTVLEALRQWAPTWLAQLPGVLSPAEQARLQRRTLGTTRERMLRELAEALEALTASQLGVVVLEDLHWSDPSTVEALTMLARRREAARLLILGTYRPVELILRAHPLKSAMAELHLHGHCEELALSYLAEAAVTAYVAPRFPTPVAPIVTPLIYQRTAGHPLFMVHLAAYLAEQAEREASAGGELAARMAAVADTVPPGVQQLIELQLGQLTADEQRLLDMASIAGGEFAVAGVAAGLQTALDLVEARCEELARQGPFLEADGLASWPDGTVSGRYRFRHALHQQVLYRRLAAARRAEGHRRTGARLEAGYGAQTAEIAGALAIHFERGHDAERAVRYRQQAADTALGRYAYQEAIGHLTRGLELLATLPETTERTRQELEMAMALGSALAATKGYAAPEVEQTYVRAQALCAQIGETPQLFPMLRGLCMFHYGRGALPTARELGEQLCRVAQREAVPALLLEAQVILGYTLLLLGDFATARTHLEPGTAHTDPTAQRPLALRYGVASGVRCLSYAALTLWCLGYPAQAARRSQEALALARALAHPYSLAFAHFYAAFLHHCLRDVAAVQAQADALLTLATAQEFPLWVGYATCWRGWALAMQGEGEAGLAQLRQGMAATLATGLELSRSFCLVLLAEAAGHAGRVEEGLRLLAEARPVLEASGRGDLLAEAYRLRGVLLLQQATPDTAQAETCFQQALAVARRQQAKAWELRAAMSLSRLWQQQGKHAEAYALLTPIYGWFTEGFDTADLQDAQALLAALG